MKSMFNIVERSMEQVILILKAYGIKGDLAERAVKAVGPSVDEALAWIDKENNKPTYRMFKLYEIASSPFSKGIASALISYTAHYATTKAYSAACVPDGIYGYLQGLITAGSPVCQTGVQIISATQVSYSTVIMMGLSRFILDIVAPSKEA